MIKRLLFAGFLAATFSLNAQEISPIPYFTYGKGLGIISPDSLFMLNISFQNSKQGWGYYGKRLRLGCEGG